MTTIKTFDTPQDFLDFNQETLNSKYFEHFHIHRLFEDLRAGKDRLMDAYNIIDEDGSNVIIVWVERLYFIYASKWTEDILRRIEEQLSEIDTTNFLFRGQKGIMLELMDKMKFDFEVINDRIIYDCEAVKPVTKPTKGKFGIATIPDIPTIVKMSVDYYIEEFEGKGQQPLEAVKQSAYDGVKQSTTFKWSSNGRIVSIARLLGNNPGNAMIGGLFTKVNERNKGYAYFLITELTKHLLNKGFKKCGLLTEATKVATNKIFEKSGYKKVYEWINIHKK